MKLYTVVGYYDNDEPGDAGGFVDFIRAESADAAAKKALAVPFTEGLIVHAVFAGKRKSVNTEVWTKRIPQDLVVPEGHSVNADECNPECRDEGEHVVFEPIKQ